MIDDSYNCWWSEEKEGEVEAPRPDDTAHMKGVRFQSVLKQLGGKTK